MKKEKRKLRFTTIRVDEEVKRLIDNAKIVGIRDSANKALRRLLGLDKLEKHPFIYTKGVPPFLRGKTQVEKHRRKR